MKEVEYAKTYKVVGEKIATSNNGFLRENDNVLIFFYYNILNLGKITCLVIYLFFFVILWSFIFPL
jgi:hypothetical protein